MLYLTASLVGMKSKEELTKKKTKTNLNLSTNLLLMRYLSFPSPPHSPFFLFACKQFTALHIQHKRRSRAKITFKVSFTTQHEEKKKKTNKKY